MTHVFISYVRENHQQVDRLCAGLRAHGVDVWIDREQLRPGYRWQQAIREAIRDGAFYVACFSPDYVSRNRTYMNEELTIAIDELRVRETDRAWFIPVRLSECPIPDRSIGGGETLRDIHWVDLFPDFERGLAKLVQVVQPGGTDSPTESKDANQASSLSLPARQLRAEAIKFQFTNGTELREAPMVDVLNAYYQDHLARRLAGFRFSDSQISVDTDAIYARLRSRLDAPGNAHLRKTVRSLEQALVDGCRLVLDYAYVKDKQVHNTYQACYWLTRAVRSWILFLLRPILEPDSREEVEYGQVAIESPLFGAFHDIERFYGFDLIKLDLWHPENASAPTMSLFFRTEGYAGKWFTENPQAPGLYKDHYSPNDFYNFVLPQMVLRHVLLAEPIVEDWSGYWIGPS